MANINFDTSNANFRSIFGNGLSYRVPRFQRDYAWTEEQWSDLWEDSRAAVDNDDEHYMGYLVLQRIDEKTFSIIDGQQRLTTVTLLIIAALYRLQSLIVQGVDVEKNKERLQLLQQSYVGAKNLVSLTVQNKLQLNRNNQPFFKSYLASLQPPRTHGAKRSDKLLAEACQFFRDKLDDLNLSGEKIAEFIDRLVDRLVFTQIRVGSDINAYRIFETLNARGVQLSTPDLLKNFLFSTIDTGSDAADEVIQNLEEHWTNIIDALGKLKFSDFLLTDWNRKQPLATKNELFKQLKKHIKSPEEAFAELKQLAQSAEIYSAIDLVDEEFWKSQHCVEAIAALRALKVFRVTQPQGMLMSAWQKWPRADFLALLKWIEVISLRYNVIGKKPAKDQESVYNQASRGILSGHTKEQVLKMLEPVYVQDDEFVAAFAAAAFRTEQNNHKVRYVLVRIEHHLNPSQQIDEALITVEHILPKKATAAWTNDFNGDAELYSQRLGNLTLMTGADNENVDRQPFKQKRETFRSSPFVVSRKASEYVDWTVEAVNSRQKWLAEQAKTVWRIER